MPLDISSPLRSSAMLPVKVSLIISWRNEGNSTAASTKSTLFRRGSSSNHSNHSRTTLLQLSYLPQDVSQVTNGATTALALVNTRFRLWIPQIQNVKTILDGKVSGRSHCTLVIDTNALYPTITTFRKPTLLVFKKCQYRIYSSKSSSISYTGSSTQLPQLGQTTSSSLSSSSQIGHRFLLCLFVIGFQGIPNRLSGVSLSKIDR